MRLNFYDIVFHATYSLMSKQTKNDLQYNQIMGVILGVMLFCVSLNFLLLDMFILFAASSTNPEINTIYGIGIYFFLLIINYFYFLLDKRYLKIDNLFKLLPREKQILYKWVSWLFMIGTFFAIFVILSFKY